MLRKWILLLFSFSFLLASCHSPVYNQTEGNVADIKVQAQEARAKSDRDAKPKSSLRVDKGAYVDKTPISLSKNPEWLNNRIVIRGDQLPFSYYSRVIGGAAGKSTLTKYQVGLDPSVKVTLNYSGTIKGALNVLASKSGYVYSIRGKKIYWQAYITRTYDIAFMPGGTDYLMGKKGGDGGGGSSSAGAGSSASLEDYTNSDYSTSEYSNISGKLSVWNDLKETIGQLMSPQGKVTVSQATTTVTVRDRPTNVELVSQYIANLNKKLSKQVLVKIQILEVDLQNDYNFGIDWNLIIRSFHNSNFVLNGNYGTPLTITPLTTQAGTAYAGSAITQTLPVVGTAAANQNIVPAYTVLLNALNQQGKTSIVSEPRAVCLNNQVSVIRIVEQEGYVASVQNTSVGGTTGVTAQQNTVTSQVTPGNVVTGLTLYILPKILGNQVYMQVNADLSTNKGFQDFGSGTSKVQLPNITVKHFNQRSKIRSGDTMILSGFRQLSNKANANQVMTSQALGGKASSEENKETIVLITPYILSGNA